MVVLVEQKPSMPAWAMTVVLVAVTWVIKMRVVTERLIKVSEVAKILVLVEDQGVVVLEHRQLQEVAVLVVMEKYLRLLLPLLDHTR